MTDKELARWLMGLAACYDYVPQKSAIARYLRGPRERKLSPAQWDELGDWAVIRFTRRFPLPGDLHEIFPELKKQKQLQADTEFRARMRQEWESRLGEGPKQSNPAADCPQIAGTHATVRQCEYDRKVDGTQPTGRIVPYSERKADVHLPVDPRRPGALHPRGKVPPRPASGESAAVAGRHPHCGDGMPKMSPDRQSGSGSLPPT